METLESEQTFTKISAPHVTLGNKKFSFRHKVRDSQTSSETFRSDNEMCEVLTREGTKTEKCSLGTGGLRKLWDVKSCLVKRSITWQGPSSWSVLAYTTSRLSLSSLLFHFVHPFIEGLGLHWQWDVPSALNWLALIPLQPRVPFEPSLFHHAGSKSCKPFI